MKPTGVPTRSTSPLEVSIIRKISRQRRMFTRRKACRGSISSTVEFVSIVHVYEVRPRKDRRGVDLISDALPFRRAVVRRNQRLAFKAYDELLGGRIGIVVVIGVLVSAIIAGAMTDHSPTSGPVILIADVDRFYEVYDSAGGHPTAEQLQRDY